MSNINIVIPMAGRGSRFSNAGYIKPKPFIDINGSPMILHVLNNLKYENARFILIVRSEHVEKEKETIKQIEENHPVLFHPIDIITEGAACTVLHARKFINDSNPLIIANSDQFISANFSDYVNDCLDRNLDGSIMTFIDTERNPKWSFAKVDSDGFVSEVKEKTPISDVATVGIYMFKNGRSFVDFGIDMIVNNDRVNNEFYVCPIYNYLIQNGKKIGIFNIKLSQMHGLGTPEDLNAFLKLNLI